MSPHDFRHIPWRSRGLYLPCNMIKFAQQLFPVHKMEGKEGIEALFLFATEGILVADEKGEIARVNPSAEKLFGYASGELIGKRVEALVPRKYSKTHEGHRTHFNEDPHARRMGVGRDLYGMRKDGTEFPVEISLSPYAGADGKKFTIAFIVDITQRKQAEEKLRNYSAELEKQVKNRTMILQEAIDELEETKKELNLSLEKERELSDLKSRFVSMASHEFRTPLATIMSSLSLVTKYGEVNEKEKQNKHIVRIKSSINSLTDILNDFLSVSKLEEGKVVNAAEPFNMKTFMAELANEMQALAKSGQKIIQSYSGNETVTLDKKLLKNVMFNLCTNAIKFSGEDKTIEITSVNKDGELRISVRDKGIGISQADQEHLFERFFRGRNATYIQGTGLGLNIVAKYMELMDGAIEFESIENEGTTFTLVFSQ
jgi:PAS domain S-box-containing protein